MRQPCAAFLAALFLFAGGAATAQEVTLTSRDGAVELRGTLLDFDGAFYRLHTEYGELSLDAAGVVCSGAACPDPETHVTEIAISGDGDAALRLLPALVAAFAEERGQQLDRATGADGVLRLTLRDRDGGGETGRVVVRPASTEEGFADLLAGMADLVLARREIRAEELDHARAAGLGRLDADNRSRVLALDALVAVVAEDNPLRAVRPETLAALLSGGVAGWEALGGPPGPLVLHLPEADSGLMQAIRDRLPGGGSGAPAVEVRRHADPAALARAVAADPRALGLTAGSAIGAARPLALTGACGIVQRPDRLGLKSEDYPLTLPVFLYMPARHRPALLRDLLAFARSAAAQRAIAGTGFVDQMPETLAFDSQGDRLVAAIRAARGAAGLRELKRLVRVLGPLERLTTSFRFRPGSAELDAQSRSNVYLLARALAAGAHAGRDLVFAGFSDRRGAPSANLALSRQRAEAVARAVQAALAALGPEASPGRAAPPGGVESLGFGASLPVACDASPGGPEANRRVEVWLR
ncbi:substrate-binding domain-containing protein [Roseivivax sp. CAU 1761]